MKKLLITFIAGFAIITVSCNKQENLSIQKDVDNTEIQPTVPPNKAVWGLIMKAIKELFDDDDDNGGQLQFDYQSGYWRGDITYPDGTYQDFGCEPGDGICKMSFTASDEIPNFPLQQDYGYGVLGINEGNLRFVILKSSLTEETYEQKYIDGILSLNAPLPLTSEMKAILGLSESFEVQSGDYFINEIHNEELGEVFLIIDFN